VVPLVLLEPLEPPEPLEPFMFGQGWVLDEPDWPEGAVVLEEGGVVVEPEPEPELVLDGAVDADVTALALPELEAAPDVDVVAAIPKPIASPSAPQPSVSPVILRLKDVAMP